MRNPTLPALMVAAAALSLAPFSAFAQHTGGGSTIGVKDRADGAAQSTIIVDEPTARYRLGGSSTMEVGVNRELKITIHDRLVELAAGRLVPKSRLAGVKLAPGQVVPREKVRIRRFPAEVVRLAPEYINYEHFVMEDGSIVIVDPRSYEIMDVIPA